jgi:hypothetical protein
MAKKLTSEKSTTVRKANGGQVVSVKKASRGSGAAFSERPLTYTSDRPSNPSAVGNKAAASPADDTYAVSMEAGEDVFARFDWALTQLAK